MYMNIYSFGARANTLGTFSSLYESAVTFIHIRVVGQCLRQNVQNK